MSTAEHLSTSITISENESIERGTFVSNQPETLSSSIVVATFNIRYAVGSHLISGSLLRRLGLKMPGRRSALVSGHIERAGQFLSDGKRMPRVDILALQEADKGTTRAGKCHVARELARILQMDYAHASTNVPRGTAQKSKQWYLDFEEHIDTNDKGDTGLALLSRFPIVETTRVDLPWAECEWRPRLAIESIVSVGQRNLHIFNAHIDPHANTDEQIDQHRAIIERAANAVGPTLLSGDFNTLTSESRVRMRGLLESHGYLTPFDDGIATWHSGLIRLQPDWIFVRDARVISCGVARELKVSDHWPVWVEIELNAPRRNKDE